MKAKNTPGMAHCLVQKAGSCGVWSSSGNTVFEQGLAIGQGQKGSVVSMTGKIA